METKSMYAQVFDSSNPNWDENREFNLMYLRAQQAYFNDILCISEGYSGMLGTQSNKVVIVCRVVL